MSYLTMTRPEQELLRESLREREGNMGESGGDQRYPVGLPLAFLADRGPGLEEAFQGWGLNISCSKLAFVTRDAFVPGARVSVNLQPVLGRALYAPLVVVSCSKNDEGKFSIDCRISVDETK